MNILSVNNVTKKYTNKVALNDVSVQIPEGKIYGLLGPNGAGKTTLIRIINQITAPDSGTVFYKDEPLGPSHIFNIGYLPEERGLYKKMEIAEQMLYFAQLKGLSRSEASKRLRFWFEKFDIMSWKDKKIEDLSKGMQQKIQFIATVLHQPALLILDEPFTGLDPINADLIRDEILALKKSGTAVIFSTHRMESVEMLCDHIALFNLSRKVLDGKTADIKKHYAESKYALTIAGKHELINIPSEYQVNHIQILGDKTQLEVKLLKGNTNSMLEVLLPNYTILSFTEIIPTINDIFKLKVAETGGIIPQSF